MKRRESITKDLLHCSSVMVLSILTGCGTTGTFTNNTIKPPKNAPFGYVEFRIDDTTRKADDWTGWTLLISKTVNGTKKNYGFIGRNVNLAPWGYSKIRRIPLEVGPHTFQLGAYKEQPPIFGVDGMYLGYSYKEYTLMEVNVDVVNKKITPVEVRIEETNGGILTVSSEVSTLAEP